MPHTRNSSLSNSVTRRFSLCYLRSSQTTSVSESGSPQCAHSHADWSRDMFSSDSGLTHFPSMSAASVKQVQHSSNAIQLTAPEVSPTFFLDASVDKAVRAIGQRGVVLVVVDLSGKVETFFIGWILVNSPLRVIRLQGSIGGRKGSCVRRSLFFISSYAPTDSSSEIQKDEFHDKLVTLVRRTAAANR